MSGRFKAPIHIVLKHSRGLALLVFGAYGGAMVALWWIDIPLIVKILFTLVAVCTLWSTTRKELYRCQPESPTSVVLDAHDHWWVHLANGKCHKAVIHPGLYVHPLVVIVPLKFNGYRRWIIMPVDGVTNSDELRRLRVRLLHRLPVHEKL